MSKYLSVITNFGCHYTCPYCVVKENNLHIPKTTIGGLRDLRAAIKKKTGVTGSLYLAAVIRFTITPTIMIGSESFLIGFLPM